MIKKSNEMLILKVSSATLKPKDKNNNFEVSVPIPVYLLDSTVLNEAG